MLLFKLSHTELTGTIDQIINSFTEQGLEKAYYLNLNNSEKIKLRLSVDYAIVVEFSSHATSNALSLDLQLRSLPKLIRVIEIKNLEEILGEKYATLYARDESDSERDRYFQNIIDHKKSFRPI